MESLARSYDENNEVNERSPLLYSKNITTNINKESKEEEYDKFSIIEGGVSDKISYMEHGSDNGIIVFYFGCSNFNNKSCFDTTGVLNRLNVRLINIDRPGYGESTLIKDYNDTPILFGKNSFKYIINYFNNENENNKYFFIGYQIGCIYVLSAAYLYPEIIDEISIICPPTPYINGPNNLSKTYSIKKCFYSYCLCCIFCCYYEPKMKNNFNNYKTYLNYCETEAINNKWEEYKYIKKYKKYLETNWKIMYENTENNENDKIWNEWFELKSKNWDFPIGSIKSNIHLWYGTKDIMSPYSSWYLNVLQNAIQHRCDGYGHLLIYPKFDQIVASMIHFDL